MPLRKETIKSEAGRNRVLSVANELPILFRKAACFAHEKRVRVDDVEKVAAGVIEVDLVRGNQRAERLGVILQECDRGAIGVGRGVQRKVESFDDGVAKTELFRPGREHLHDRTLRGGHAEEIKRWRNRAFELRHRQTLVIR